MDQKVSYSRKNIINMVSVPLEVLWMISDRIVDFLFFVNFHRSGPGKFSVFEL